MEAEPHKKLVGLYTQTLEALKAIPEDSAYRKAMEQVAAHRLNIVKAEPLVTEIEA